MKKLTMGIFASREDAEKAINRLHNELKINTDDISYIYRNTAGTVMEVDPSDVSSDTAGEGAKKGATIGGTVGALAGIAAVAGVIPIVGPLLAAGPIVSLLGLTTAIGTTAVGVAAGAVTGGLIGALVNLGVGEERAQRYSDRVNAGDILVSATTEKGMEAASVLTESGATDVNLYKASV